MNNSSSLTNILPALLNAQKSIESADKDGTNPHFRSTYSTLGSVIEACKKPLNDNGLVIMQPIEGDKVRTIVFHKSGEYMSDEGTSIICARQNDPQAYGSAITYAKRYGMMAMLAIPSEDDDGEAATPEKPSTKSVQLPEPVSDLTMTCKLHNVSMREYFSKAKNTPYFAHIHDNKYCFGK